MKHESTFKELRVKHHNDIFQVPKCCINVKRKFDVFKDNIAIKSGEIVSSTPEGKRELNRITSFTLSGNSSLHFELSSDPTELIGAIFWQLKRVKIEKYEPVLVGGQRFGNQS